MPIVFTPNRAEHYFAKWLNMKLIFRACFTFGIPNRRALGLSLLARPRPSSTMVCAKTPPRHRSLCRTASGDRFFEGWGTVAAQLEIYDQSIA
jgi:hypothetical protein